MPHLFPSLLGIAQVVIPCQPCFWVPLPPASRWEARRRLKGRKKRKRKPSTSLHSPAAGTFSCEVTSLSGSPVWLQIPASRPMCPHVPWWTSSPPFPSNPRIGRSFPQWQFLRFPRLWLHFLILS